MPRSTGFSAFFSLLRASLASGLTLVAIVSCSDNLAPKTDAGLDPSSIVIIHVPDSVKEAYYASLAADPVMSGNLVAPARISATLSSGSSCSAGGTAASYTKEASTWTGTLSESDPANAVALQATPFLNISTRVLSGGERGLLSVAFHPNYATNHFFYVYFTSQTTGDIRIERFTTTANADVADPASTKLIFTTPHPNGNHNGGLVSFGPDGMLYAAFGDGGGGSPDQDGNGQNFNAYLGGMIRINVDQGDPYSVPATNPFVGQANKKPELWAKGFRNPWRYAFDAATQLLYIADVGESAHEEVDAVGATLGGLNFGWRIMEGSSCFGAATCSQTGLTLPVLDYTHANGACSITGGYVYRGPITGIRGHYFYSDFCAGFLKSFRYENGVAVDQKDWGITMTGVTSFGVDLAGELYIMTGSNIVKVAQGT